MIQFSKKNYNKTIPFFYSENVFDKKFFQELVNDFPTNENALGENPKFQNSRLRVRSKNLYEFVAKKKSWKKLYHYLNSKDFCKYAFNLFDDKFDNSKFYFKKSSKLMNFIFTKILKKKRIETSSDISLAGLNYHNQPHCDRGHRLYIMLVYFCDKTEEKMEGGEIVFHKIKSGITPQLEKNRFYKEKDLDEIINFPPKKNFAVIFKNTEQAIHSVNRIISIKGSRKFLYFSIDAV